MDVNAILLLTMVLGVWGFWLEARLRLWAGVVVLVAGVAGTTAAVRQIGSVLMDATFNFAFGLCIAVITFGREQNFEAFPADEIRFARWVLRLSLAALLFGGWHVIVAGIVQMRVRDAGEKLKNDGVTFVQPGDGADDDGDAE